RAALAAGPRPGLPTRVLPPPPGPFQQWLEVLVSDDGAGIAAANLDVLFQAFRQIDSSMSRNHEGTGLGLSLVSRLAALHGGAVGVSSAPGQGAHFAIWLPLRSSPQDAPPAHAPDGRRALVVEDDPAAADLLRLQLEGAGFTVSCAANAAGALEQARAARPDLITLDLLLPDSSGWSVLQQLRAEPGLESVPVVVVSILAEEMHSCLLGAAHFLPKPVLKDDLDRALYALGLGADRQQAPHVMIVDESANSLALRAALAGLNYQVSYYADGPQAMAAAQADAVDLLVLGPMRDEASGMALLEVLRSDTRLPPPVLVLSERQPGAYAKPDLPQGGLDTRQFLHEVGRALRAREATPWHAS
ncbi:MAG TPA: response regulator, partial [Pseudoduganella sp.]